MTPRHWVLDIDPPAEFLTTNARGDRRGASGKVKAWRRAGFDQARSGGLPTGLGRVRIDIVVAPPHRQADQPNYDPTCKAIVDGLGPPFVRRPSGRSRGAAAPGYKLIPNDSARHLDGHHMHVVDPQPPHGRVTVYITDLTYVPPGRTWTPRLHIGNDCERIEVKRACNGCGELLGNLTNVEIEDAVDGRPLPDVRGECPACSFTAGGGSTSRPVQLAAHALCGCPLVVDTRQVEHKRRCRYPAAAAAVTLWNQWFEQRQLSPVGAPVRYWPGARHGPGASGTTRTRAQVFEGHTAVVWLEGVRGAVSLSHVENATRRYVDVHGEHWHTAGHDAYGQRWLRCEETDRGTRNIEAVEHEFGPLLPVNPAPVQTP